MDIFELTTHANGLQYLPAFTISLAIGLLVGLDRERIPSTKAGLRTFTLTTLLGTLLAMLSEMAGTYWMLVAGLLAVAAMIVTTYIGVHNEEDPGTTTQAALMLSYCLGAIVWHGYGTIAIMLAVTMTVLLHFKPELQTLSKSLSRQDIQSVLQFAVLSLIILPILPNQDYGPYGTINPHQVWSVVVLISGVSLAGYVALRLVGQRYGAPLLGFFGGLVSSTVATLVYARHGKHGEALARLSVVVILIANLVVLVRLAIISAIIAPGISPHILPVLLTGLVFGGAVTFMRWRDMEDTRNIPELKVTNPTELKAALSFGALYAVVLMIAAWLSDIGGSKGLYLLASISGLMDVDAITLSTLRLFEQARVNEWQTVMAISIAFFANLVFKLGMVFVVGGLSMMRQIVPAAVAVVAGMGIALLFFSME